MQRWPHCCAREAGGCAGGDSVNEQALHQAYQAAKREWMAANPNATPAMFEAAMQAIAERLGL